MKIAVLSGKGGVGKSLVSASLFKSISRKEKTVALDCDADNPCLRFWLGVNDFDKEHPLYISEKAVSKEMLKTSCPFGAIKNGKIILPLCHGCGVCKEQEPKKVEMKKSLTGWIRQKGNLFWGQLRPGETGSGKIVEELKKMGNEIEHNIEIRDSPAGLGCGTKAAVRDVDFGLIVVEPAPSSLVALKGTSKLLSHFKVPYKVILNKVGLNEKIENHIRKNYRIATEIPYKREVFESLQKMETPKFLKSRFEKIWEGLI